MGLANVGHFLDGVDEDGIVGEDGCLGILDGRYRSWFDNKISGKRFWFYWVDWIEKEVSVRQSNAFGSECTSDYSEIFLPDATLNRIVYMLVSFTLYISRVCPCCASALENIKYRIHPQYGIQTRVASGAWVPDPDALSAAFAQANSLA